MQNNIRKIINDKGLKISDVIIKCELSRSSFYEIMNGNSTPKLVNARKIANVLGVLLDELFPNDNFKEDKDNE